jgi:hypothetical protein
MRKTLLALAIAGVTVPVAHADEWFVEAHYPDHAALVRGAALFQHVMVDAGRQVLRVDTDDDGIRQLEDAGLSVSVDAGDTARMRAFYARTQDAIQSREPQETDGGYPSIPGYACYRTVEGTYQTMDDLAATQPGLAEIHTLGPSWQKTQNAATGYDMRTLRVTNLATAAADPDRPKMVVFGSIHAREYTPAELLTRMAEWLVSGYGTDPEATWLVDHVDFRFILQANPDGRKKAETGQSWRKNTDTANGNCTIITNSSGIDLNRNFPFHWHTTGESGSSSNKCDEDYRGPTAASEPETQNLVAYVAGSLGTNGVYSGGVLPDRRPDDVSIASPDDYTGLFFDIHSYSQLVLWPWGDTTNAAPNRTPLQTFGRRLAWFNGYTPEQSDSLYPTDGATDDNFYGTLGVPAYTIELGVQFFESCNTFTSTTYPKNFAALRYAARAAVAPFRLPGGPDAYGITATAPATGSGGLYTTVSATIDDLRYKQTNGTQTTYPVRAANAYVDLLPWELGAVPIALSAVDGTFDAKTETVRGDITLTGLAPGRHIVYVQGINTLGGGNGTPGTPNAVFVDVPQAPTTVTATPQIIGEGSVDPSTPQTVISGTALSFTVTPGIGQHVTSVGGCPGAFIAPVFTTDPLLSSCTLTATFEPDQFTIGGTVSGLGGNGLTLSLNGSISLPVPANATSFVFPGTLPYGSPYEVTIATLPAHQDCTLSGGNGTVDAQVSDVVVSCGPDANDIIFRNGFDSSTL